MQCVEKESKARLARELGVSRASLYYRHKLPERDQAVRRQIEAVMQANPGYGSPHVAIALKINKKRAARVMRNFGCRACEPVNIKDTPSMQGCYV